MENASKALLIAGAILLSILLITLGIMVFSNAKGTINDVNLDAQQVQAFNSKFIMYCGNKVSAAKVNALVEAVTANNARNTDKISITIDGLTSGTDYTGSVSSANGYNLYSYVFTATRTYTVDYATSTTGVVNAITIKP